MKNSSSDSHLVFADTMILAVVLWTYFCDIQSHCGFVSEKESKTLQKLFFMGNCFMNRKYNDGHKIISHESDEKK